MDAKEPGAAVGDGGGVLVSKPSASSRPTLSLPLRSSVESLFKGSDASPGPMTLVSSFFSEYDPDSDCRSFSQLLAGAMASPNAQLPLMNSASPTANFEVDNNAPQGATSNARFKTMPPARIPITISRPPYFTIPPGISPTTLLDSPVLLQGAQGPFGISHQQALAQVQAQAHVQAHGQMQVQATSYPPPIASSTMTLPLQVESSAGADAINYVAPLQQKAPAPLETSQTVGLSEPLSQSTELNQRSVHPIHPIIVERPSDDGYNWRKYGQKQVKGSEYPRSYYKCTHPSCPVKKKVERSHDGQVTEIVYKSEHNHSKPQPNRRMAAAAQNSLFDREARFPGGGTNDKNESLDIKMDGSIQGFSGDASGRNANISDASTSMRAHDTGHGSSEQSSASSDDGEDGSRADDGDDDEPDSKRRKKEKKIKEIIGSHRTIREPRIVVQTRSDVDILDDGYRWRKYGQKVVKGNPHPRSYYKCTNVGCSVRKHVERASNDVKAVITTYEGKHNHDVPAARNSSHDAAGSGSQFHAGSSVAGTSGLQKPPNFLLDQQAANCLPSLGWTSENRAEGAMQTSATLQPKEEHETFSSSTGLFQNAGQRLV